MKAECKKRKETKIGESIVYKGRESEKTAKIADLADCI